MAAYLAGSSRAVVFVVVRHQRDLPSDPSPLQLCESNVLSAQCGTDLQAWQNSLPLPHSTRIRTIGLEVWLCTDLILQWLRCCLSNFRVKTFEIHHDPWFHEEIHTYFKTSSVVKCNE